MRKSRVGTRPALDSVATNWLQTGPVGIDRHMGQECRKSTILPLQKAAEYVRRATFRADTREPIHQTVRF
jgi:hypothetical protein